jgi:hypothetical protein
MENLLNGDLLDALLRPYIEKIVDIYSCDVDPLFLHVDPLGKLAIIVRA